MEQDETEFVEGKLDFVIQTQGAERDTLQMRFHLTKICGIGGVWRCCDELIKAQVKRAAHVQSSLLLIAFLRLPMTLERRFSQ